MKSQPNQQNIDVELEPLMGDVDKFSEDPDKKCPEEFDEEEFVALFNRGLPVYKRFMDECTQEELDAYNDKYDNFQPFFKTIQDQFENHS